MTRTTISPARVVIIACSSRSARFKTRFRTATIIPVPAIVSELSAIDEAIGRRVEEITRGDAVNVPR